MFSPKCVDYCKSGIAKIEKIYLQRKKTYPEKRRGALAALLLPLGIRGLR
jgi:hypothetical protein